MATISKNTLGLIYTGIITVGFLTAGILDVLDYFIVKVLLFTGFAFFGIYMLMIILKNTENKNHSK
ncbi:hypothetical protein [Ichthyenterobacterium magnum]|uniref:Uncharacterized protein n=1 Tax=Ichthyenterobacterium magnum TaxID=1230530 RepID=A0A420DL99_9FLAO|nr:hypothetical protein [Ichthyenterobacterium magnum]RKE94978.1 hypothetical protein BXY80_1995 [Ichthyenterobacterium magnum]